MNAAMEKVRILGSSPLRFTYSLMVGSTRARNLLWLFSAMESSRWRLNGLEKRSKIAEAKASRSALGRSSVGMISLKSAWLM